MNMNTRAMVFALLTLTLSCVSPLLSGDYFPEQLDPDETHEDLAEYVFNFRYPPKDIFLQNFEKIEITKLTKRGRSSFWFQSFINLFLRKYKENLQAIKELKVVKKLSLNLDRRENFYSINEEKLLILGDRLEFLIENYTPNPTLSFKEKCWNPKHFFSNELPLRKELEKTSGMIRNLSEFFLEKVLNDFESLNNENEAQNFLQKKHLRIISLLSLCKFINKLSIFTTEEMELGKVISKVIKKIERKTQKKEEMEFYWSFFAYMGVSTFLTFAAPPVGWSMFLLGGGGQALRQQSDKDDLKDALRERLTNKLITIFNIAINEILEFYEIIEKINEEGAFSKLHIATLCDDRKAIENLLTKEMQYCCKHFPLVDKEGDNPFHYAIEKGNPKIIEELLFYDNELPFQEEFNINGVPPLHLILEAHYDITTIKEILSIPGLNLNVQDELGRTLLYRAAEEYNKELVQALMDAGADPSIRTYDMENPIKPCRLIRSNSMEEIIFPLPLNSPTENKNSHLDFVGKSEYPIWDLMREIKNINQNIEKNNLEESYFIQGNGLVIGDDEQNKIAKNAAFLFFGSFGTGKTCLARVFADEIGAKCFEINAKDFSSEEQIRNFFQNAHDHFEESGRESVCLINEIDDLEEEYAAVVASEIDRLSNKKKVNKNSLKNEPAIIFIGTTNKEDVNELYPEKERIARRCSKKIGIKKPNHTLRKIILSYYISKLPELAFESKEDLNEFLEELSEITREFSCRMIKIFIQFVEEVAEDRDEIPCRETFYEAVCRGKFLSLLKEPNYGFCRIEISNFIKNFQHLDIPEEELEDLFDELATEAFHFSGSKMESFFRRVEKTFEKFGTITRKRLFTDLEAEKAWI